MELVDGWILESAALEEGSVNVMLLAGGATVEVCYLDLALVGRREGLWAVIKSFWGGRLKNAVGGKKVVCSDGHDEGDGSERP